MKKESKRNNAAPKAHPSRKTQGSSIRSPLSCAVRNSLIGFLWTLPVCVLLIFISALVAMKSPDPSSLVCPLSIASLIASFAACGFISGKLNSSSVFLCSLISGSSMAIFIMLLSLFVQDTTGGFAPLQRTLLYAAALAASLIGGFLSSLKPKRSKKPKRRK